MDTEKTTELTQTEIIRAATNDPELSTVTVTLGDRTFTVVDLPYDDYIKFLARLQPLMEAFIGKMGALHGMQSPDLGNLNAASLVTYCSEDLPEMAVIMCRQTDPTITVEEVKRLAKNPFKLATAVLTQIEQNRMISDFSDFFVQILPLMKAATGKGGKLTTGGTH